MYCNFISPPAVLEKKQNHSILIIDPDEKTVKDLETICKSVGTDFDVYFYAAVCDDLQWLETAFNMVDVVLIDTIVSGISPIKDRLTAHPKCYHYGPKRFVNGAKHINSAQEYFLLYIQQQQNIDLSE